jgi:hypothetical protein
MFTHFRFFGFGRIDRGRGVLLEFDTSSGSNSAVECDLAKVEVAGSNPVSRSSNFPGEEASPISRKRFGFNSFAKGTAA